MGSLSIVLKTVERCNLNCSYCYFFNGLDQTYLKRPKFVSTEVIDSLISFIKDGITHFNLTNISIVLHGGEPLMQPKEDFIYLIESFRNKIKNINLSFSIQTNAILATKKWTDLFNKYEVGVGVSIDGPQEYNDKYRVDHRGNGSYERVINGIKLLQDNLIDLPGCLTVINPEFSGAKIYRHLVNLGFKSLDFLLPDNNYANPPPHTIEKYTSFLSEVFEEWVTDNNEKITIRKFKSIILQLLGHKSLIYGFGNEKANDTLPLLSIRSDGSIYPTDELLSTDPKSVTLINKNVNNSSLQEIVECKIFHEINKARRVIPQKCRKCCWYNACGSGNLVSRFSEKDRFNNHSIYCQSLEEIYAQITAYLINSGISQNIITDNLLKRYYLLDA